MSFVAWNNATFGSNEFAVLVFKTFVPEFGVSFRKALLETPEHCPKLLIVMICLFFNVFLQFCLWLANHDLSLLEDCHIFRSKTAQNISELPGARVWHVSVAAVRTPSYAVMVPESRADLFFSDFPTAGICLTPWAGSLVILKSKTLILMEKQHEKMSWTLNKKIDILFCSELQLENLSSAGGTELPSTHPPRLQDAVTGARKKLQEVRSFRAV